MNGDLQIRKLVLTDVPVVAALEREIFPDPWSRNVFLREAQLTEDSFNRVVVDTRSGELLAYLIAWFVADEVHLANVAVAPVARRRGLAQWLLEELESEGVRRGARLVALEVRRSNKPAQSLYMKNGYAKVSIRKRYYQDNREDALVMIKALDVTGHLPPAEAG